MEAFIIFNGDFRNAIESFKNEHDDIEWDSMKWNPDDTSQSYDWKSDSYNRIKHAKSVVYLYGGNRRSENVKWEIEQSVKLNKQILIAPVDGDADESDIDFPEYEISIRKAMRDDSITPSSNGVLWTLDNMTFFRNRDCLCRKLKSLLSIDYKVFNDKDKIFLRLSDEDAACRNGESAYEGPRHDKEITENELCYANACIEQYKLFLETSESLLDRRQNVNTFYISVNSALVALFTILIAFDMKPLYRFVVGALFSILGIILALSWSRLLQSYGDLNRSKMAILQTIEKRLPLSLFDPEWSALMDTLNDRKYVSFTESEKMVPKLFIGVYTILFLVMTSLAIF